MSATHYTGSSGSDHFPSFPPEPARTSSSSASVHSPISVDSRSNTSSFGDEDWTNVRHPDLDGIDPSDSASRSRQPIASRRTTTEAPQPPSRRDSSRRAPSTHVHRQREEPRRRESHQSRTSRHQHHRSESRRLPSDDSISTLATDDHPYGQGQRYRAGYAHPSHAHAGYPPSVMSTGPYVDPFQQAQALVHMPQTDAFGYPTGANPFAAHGGGAPNPFSPISSAGTAPGYFPAEPAHAPPMHQIPRPPARSVYSNGSAYGSEVYHPQAAVYPGYPPIYPQMPFMYPPSQPTSPPPPGQPKDSTTSKELESLRELIRKHEEERVAREKAMIAKAEADAAATAARMAKEEEEAKKKQEIAAASAKAKKDAEEAAADVAKKAKEESDKKLAEAQKAKDEAEKKKKELEDEIKKNKPSPDASKEPIKFKDAVHRTFSFPWAICKTWKGMEGLVKQAFAHVDVIGEHVLAGHYDLKGPDDEIILPQVWETTVQPGWVIEMHMWPIAELEKSEKPSAMSDPFGGFSMEQLLGGLGGDAAAGAAKAGKKSGKGSKKDKKRQSQQIVEVPMAPPANDPLAGMFPPGILPGLVGVVPDKKVAKGAKAGSSKKKSQDIPLLAQWMGVRPAKKR